MTERSELLTSIAGHIKNFRAGEIPQPTPDHVDRWVSQFSPGNQLALLREFNHVIDKSFIEKDLVESFVDYLITNAKLVGADPASYWKTANFLRIQKDGMSQREMLKLFDEALQKKLGMDLKQCGMVGGDFIYLDDVLFSGNRVATDVEAWLKEKAPPVGNLNVIVMALYTGASYYLRSKRLKEAIERSGKKIEIKYWRMLEMENQLNRSASSDVFWPAIIPDEPLLRQYVASQRYEIKVRAAGGSSHFFASEGGRQLLEYEFTNAGLQIMSRIQNQRANQRPLGFSLFGFGFGSTLVTYRNCPNNCPLAYWWGDPTATSGALHWYPLLPRKTYQSAENIFKDFDDLT